MGKDGTCHFYQKTEGVYVVFIIFAPDLLFNFHNFATYLREANLYKSAFSSSERVCSLDFETEKEVITS